MAKLLFLGGLAKISGQPPFHRAYYGGTDQGRDCQQIPRKEAVFVHYAGRGHQLDDTGAPHTVGTKVPPQRAIEAPEDRTHQDLVERVEFCPDPIDQADGSIREQPRCCNRNQQRHKGADESKTHRMRGGHAVVAGAVDGGQEGYTSGIGTLDVQQLLEQLPEHRIADGPHKEGDHESVSLVAKGKKKRPCHKHGRGRTNLCDNAVPY